MWRICFHSLVGWWCVCYSSVVVSVFFFLSFRVCIFSISLWFGFSLICWLYSCCHTPICFRNVCHGTTCASSIGTRKLRRTKSKFWINAQHTHRDKQKTDPISILLYFFASTSQSLRKYFSKFNTNFQKHSISNGKRAKLNKYFFFFSNAKQKHNF